MRVCPELFSWSVQERERYGVNLPDKARQKLDRALMKELFGARIRSWKNDAHGNKRIPLRELNRWNEAILPLVGGWRGLFLSKRMAGRLRTILDFPTLRDYDEGDYRYQENARKEQDARYAGKPSAHTAI